MTTQIQRRRGTTAQHSTFTGAVGEVTVDTDKEVLVVHDGAQVGGYPQMRENGSNSALALGSAGTPSLKFAGDTNTGIYSPGADQVAISTGGSGRLFVDSSGRVGVGTANPTSALHIDVASGEPFRLRSQTAGSNYLTHVNHAGGDLAYVGAGGGAALNSGTTSDYAIRANQGALLFGTNGNNERARIDSSGRLLVGTSSALSGSVNANFNSGNALLQVVGNSSGTPRGAIVALGRSQAASAISANDFIGGLIFNDNGSAEFAHIFCYADAAAGTGDHPSRLVFSTTADGASSPTERMRLTSTGQLRLAGAGITFNGDTATANELDDYEEGTWTPSQGGGLTVSGSFSSEGTYTKIGRFVIAHGTVAGSTSVSIASENAIIAGSLPFTAGTSATVAMYGNAGNNATTDGMVVQVAGTTIYATETMAATQRIFFTVTYTV